MVFKKLVKRGGAVMREWNSYEGLDEGSEMMIAAVTANTVATLCGESMKNWSPQEGEDKLNAVRIALNSAFQMGRSSRRHVKSGS